MMPTPGQVCILVERCEQFRESKAPDGYRQGLALCIVDSVQSTGVTYSSVVNVVNGYRDYRRHEGGDPSTDGTPELVSTFDQLGGPDGWAKEIGNRNKTSTQAGAPLKALAIEQAARALIAQGVNTADDLRSAVDDPVRQERVGTAWQKVPGQGSGITWHYVQMLAGVPGVKPDRMIIRFVAKALGLPPRRVTPQFALEAVKAAAAQMGMSPTDLDHGIWQWQRRR